jgi:hypothetical protein
LDSGDNVIYDFVWLCPVTDAERSLRRTVLGWSLPTRH